MPAIAATLEPVKRQTYTCPSGYYQSGYYCYNAWDAYGRWILLAAVVVGAFLIFCIFSCITARRRRRLGQMPYRGTGWASGGQPGGYPTAQPSQYYQNNTNWGGQPAPQQGWQQPPPQYGAPDGTHYGTKAGPQQPYGGQESGAIELQGPQSAYQPQAGSHVYQPPAGPPPGKGDGVIR